MRQTRRRKRNDYKYERSSRNHVVEVSWKIRGASGANQAKRGNTVESFYTIFFRRDERDERRERKCLDETVVVLGS